MTTYGYARVSSRDQNLDRQIEAFRNFGIAAENIYADKKSGKNFDRAEYKNLVKVLREGDLLVIKSIDRLGRNYDAIIAEWSYLTSTIKADILVLDMPILDTRTKDGSLMGKLISDIVLQLLSFVAENERANIRSRQAEGIALAKARGVKFGRPHRDYSEFIQIFDSYLDQSITVAEALRVLDIKKSNFYYHLAHYKKSSGKSVDRKTTATAVSISPDVTCLKDSTAQRKIRWSVLVGSVQKTAAGPTAVYPSQVIHKFRPTTLKMRRADQIVVGAKSENENIVRTD